MAGGYFLCFLCGVLLLHLRWQEPPTSISLLPALTRSIRSWSGFVRAFYVCFWPDTLGMERNKSQLHSLFILMNCCWPTHVFTTKISNCLGAPGKKKKTQTKPKHVANCSEASTRTCQLSDPHESR